MTDNTNWTDPEALMLEKPPRLTLRVQAGSRVLELYARKLYFREGERAW